LGENFKTWLVRGHGTAMPLVIQSGLVLNHHLHSSA